MKKRRILIGSCVCQKPKILDKFLSSLSGLELSAFDVSFTFVDDNQDKESSAMLFEAANERFGGAAVKTGPPKDTDYCVNDITHFWSDSLVLRVAELKNGIITDAVNGGFDFLFLIDSDLLIDPGLINHLALQEKDIISEIFWTSWRPGMIPMPNTWLYDMYEMAAPSLNENVRNATAMAFVNSLKTPGVYEVGGLGACTFISVNALKAGLNFSPIKNVSFWGEDRWFCIRAAAMGYKLFIDTNFPAKHLYRESDITE